MSKMIKLSEANVSVRRIIAERTDLPNALVEALARDQNDDVRRCIAARFESAATLIDGEWYIND